MDEKDLQNNSEVKTIHTYLSDMADNVRDNQVSVMKVALAEQNKHDIEDVYKSVEGSPLKKFFWFLGGIIFILVSACGIYYVIQKKAKDNILQVVQKVETIISYNEVENVEISNTQNLTTKIKKIVSQNLNAGIKYIYIFKNVNEVKDKVATSELFSNLELTAPSSFVRSLSDSYMIGTYTKSNNDKSKLFILLQTNNYEFSYAGALEWENSLASDMLDIFELKTKESKIQINDRKWKDIIVNNKDTRVFLNEDDQPILYYIFIDKENLLIADSVDTIKEVMSRLIIKNIKPL